MDPVHAAFMRVIEEIRATVRRAPVDVSDAIDDLTDDLVTLWGGNEPRVPDEAVDWRELGLTPKPAKFCELLYKNLGRPVSREALMNWAYPDGQFPVSKTLDVMICWARQALASTQFRIENVWGVGYRMVHADADCSHGAAAQRVLWRGQWVSPTTVALANSLMANAGTVVSWKELLTIAASWSPERVTRAIGNVKGLIADEYLVRSEWGVGYVAIPKADAKAA